MLYIIYILSSINKSKTYVGYTNDLKKRIEYHNRGKVNFTKHYRPWKLVYKELAFLKEEAKRREAYWKSGAGRRNIKRILNGFPPNFKKVRRGSPK